MVWACDSNPKAFISLKHTVAMIKDLEMKVLAEGVETENQKEILTGIGVEYLQGYYFSRPLPILEVMEVIKNTLIKGKC
jgi:EAL domain-containing protein (putative c-di-GMP-specific phosphodiesterase class I)